MEPHEERRSDRRFRICLPVMVMPAKGRSVPAHTRDISSRGICFYLPRPLAVDSAIEFLVTLPADVTLTAPVRIKCLGRIIRVEENSVSTGIAAVIQKYQFLAD
jgi:hypothetical protein